MHNDKASEEKVSPRRAKVAAAAAYSYTASLETGT